MINIVDHLRELRWKFVFHYAFEPNEIYLPPEYWMALVEETRYTGNAGDATFMGAYIHQHDGDIMLICRRGNAVFRFMNGSYDHVVTDLEEEIAAFWREVPQ